MASGDTVNLDDFGVSGLPNTCSILSTLAVDRNVGIMGPPHSAWLNVAILQKDVADSNTS